ncbi:MAG: carboxypeptidase-like regulatory domain-containing protein, partial [Muribaculaceae bacterium]|nr:carboxypeptidase-like regulatory domain-containing protein [Muribaculaceae bacterium]
MLNHSLTWNRVCYVATLLFAIGFSSPQISASTASATEIGKSVITVKGTVYDESKEPLVGATVLVKGASTGVITNADGKYVINVPSDGVLVFTYVGMDRQEVPVDGRDMISVTMKDNAVALDDVVVIGYGTQSRATVTAAISKVSADDLAVSPSGDPMSMLQG